MTNENRQLAAYNGAAFALAESAENMALVQGAFESGVRIFDLQKLKVPSGGSVTWMVPQLGGEMAARQLDVVIAHVQGRQRAWWNTEPGVISNTPPNCTTNNGVIGIGNNSLDGNPAADGEHKCMDCPWSRMGSKRMPGGGTGRGSDCANFARVFCFTPDSVMPIMLKVPPASLAALSKYNVELLSARRAPYSVVTRLTLEKMTNPDGQPYARILVSFIGDLPADQVEHFKSMSAYLRDQVASVVFDVTPEDVGMATGN